MGIGTDRLFFDILSSDAQFMQRIGGRLYNTVIGKPDIDELNEPVPYAIIMFAGLVNDDGTKDDPFESETDTVNIEIELTANDPDELTELVMMIRSIVHKAMTDNMDSYDPDTAMPTDYRFSTSDKTYVYEKPCYVIVLKWSCDIMNSLTTNV
jgi:hypothetical protein